MAAGGSDARRRVALRDVDRTSLSLESQLHRAEMDAFFWQMVVVNIFSMIGTAILVLLALRIAH